MPVERAETLQVGSRLLPADGGRPIAGLDELPNKVLSTAITDAVDGRAVAAREHRRTGR